MVQSTGDHSRARKPCSHVERETPKRSTTTQSCSDIAHVPAKGPAVARKKGSHVVRLHFRTDSSASDALQQSRITAEKRCPMKPLDLPQTRIMIKSLIRPPLAFIQQHQGFCTDALGQHTFVNQSTASVLPNLQNDEKAFSVLSHYYAKPADGLQNQRAWHVGESAFCSSKGGNASAESEAKEDALLAPPKVCSSNSYKVATERRGSRPLCCIGSKHFIHDAGTRLSDPFSSWRQKQSNQKNQQTLVRPQANSVPVRLSLLDRKLQYQFRSSLMRPLGSSMDRTGEVRSTKCSQFPILMEDTASETSINPSAAQRSEQQNSGQVKAESQRGTKQPTSTSAALASSWWGCGCCSAKIPLGLCSVLDRQLNSTLARETPRLTELIGRPIAATLKFPMIRSRASSSLKDDKCNRSLTSLEVKDACQMSQDSVKPASLPTEQQTLTSATETETTKPDRGAESEGQRHFFQCKAAAAVRSHLKNTTRREKIEISCFEATKKRLELMSAKAAPPSRVRGTMDISGPSDGETATTTAGASPPIGPFEVAVSDTTAEIKPRVAFQNVVLRESTPSNSSEMPVSYSKHWKHSQKALSATLWDEEGCCEEEGGFMLLRHSSVSFVCVDALISFLNVCCSISCFGGNEYLQRQNDLTTSPFHCSSRPQISIEEYLLKRIFKHGKQCVNEGLLALAILSRFLCAQNALLHAALNGCEAQGQHHLEKCESGRDSCRLGPRGSWTTHKATASTAKYFAATASGIGFVEFNYLTAHRLLLTATLLARKTHRDDHTNIRHWAEVSDEM